MDTLVISEGKDLTDEVKVDKELSISGSEESLHIQ